MALDKLIHFRASDKDAKLLESLEKSYGVNKSEIMRLMIRREVEDRALEIVFKSDALNQERLFALGEMISKDQVLTNV